MSRSPVQVRSPAMLLNVIETNILAVRSAKSRGSFPLLFAGLTGITLVYRLPYLLNPERMHSEHAFLGLQALQMRQGHWQWFLWGSNYQAALEPLVGAFFFGIFGPSYRSLQA